MAKRRALLIGVNSYRIPGADLRGCINDVDNIRAMLLRWFDFPRSGIRTLTDGRATQSRVKAAIGKIVDSARRGDVVLIHFSGHGSNIPDTDGDEADERDEILCPHDLDWKADEQLSDDWLRGALDAVADGVNLTVNFDCCHSGTGTRPIPRPGEPIARFLANPLDLLAAESGRPLRGEVHRVRRQRSRDSGGGDVHDVEIPEVLLTGSRDDQTSADAFIDGDYHGAMTYSMWTTVDRAKGDLTYRQLHERMTDYLQDSYSQVPQLEGRAARLDMPVLQPL